MKPPEKILLKEDLSSQLFKFPSEKDKKCAQKLILLFFKIL